MSGQQENKIFNVLGMMSGTSLDGVDVALLRTNGDDVIEPSDKTIFHPYTPETQELIKAAFMQRDEQSDVVVAARDAVTKSYCEAYTLFTKRFGDEAIDMIGAHGQTITHLPQEGKTIQILDAQSFAEQCGIPVYYRFRHNDMTQGGQGAPLLPIYHRALMLKAGYQKAVSVLNFGGVANITAISERALRSDLDDIEAQDFCAFDTGPANAYLDDWVRQHTDLPYDRGGEIASKGRVDEDIVAEFLSHAYFDQPVPKSLDRQDFDFLLGKCDGLSLEDGAATLAESSVRAVLKALDHCAQIPETLFVCGGGAQNPYIMQRLDATLPCAVKSFNALGFDADMVEAQGFAYFAARCSHGLPITFPGTTGCQKPATGGEVVYPAGMDWQGTIKHG